VIRHQRQNSIIRHLGWLSPWCDYRRAVFPSSYRTRVLLYTEDIEWNWMRRTYARVTVSQSQYIANEQWRGTDTSIASFSLSRGRRETGTHDVFFVRNVPFNVRKPWLAYSRVAYVSSVWNRLARCDDYQVRRNKVPPLKFFAVFSATVWNFNFNLYTFISWNVLHLTAKWNVIHLKNDEVIDFLTSPPTDFSAGQAHVR